MTGFIYISVLLVAIAFLITVIYISFILKRVANTMQSVSTALTEVENQVAELKPQITVALQETSSLVDDVTEKVEATEPAFDSMQLLGQSLQSTNTALQNSLGNLSDEEMDQKLKPYIEGIRWSEVGMSLYKDWKEIKPAANKE